MSCFVSLNSLKLLVLVLLRPKGYSSLLILPFSIVTYRQIKGNCPESFTEYWTCLDYCNLHELRHCRKQQKEFDNCVLDKLGWERPDLGNLSKVNYPCFQELLSSSSVNIVRRKVSLPCISLQVQPIMCPSMFYLSYANALSFLKKSRQDFFIFLL